MKKLSLIFILVSLLFGPFSSFASHLMGSDITWECLGQDSFKVTVTVYRDCNGIGLSGISLTASCKKSGKKIASKSQSPGTAVDITPVCAKQKCTMCKSTNCSFKYGIQQYTLNYVFVFDSVPNNCCEILLSWDQCCRNGAITTGAAGENFYVEATLNRCVTPCDNSPKITELPITILCKGQDVIFNQGVYDKDVDSTGKYDSLVVSLTDPLIGHNDPVSWIGKYDYDLPLFFWGFPQDNLPAPRGFHLDHETGDLQYRPMKEEQTVMAFSIKEFRNGKEIGEIRHDMQVIVLACPNNSPPLLAYYSLKEVCAGDTVVMKIGSYDPDNKRPDTVRLTFNQGNVPGNPTWTDSNGVSKHSRGIFKWVPSDALAGNVYTFFVTANDDACPVNASAVRAYRIKVKPRPTASYEIKDSLGCGKVYMNATPISSGVFKYLWQDSNGVISTNKTVVHQFPKPGKNPVSLTVAAQGCSRTYFDMVNLSAFIYGEIGNDTTVCEGSDVSYHLKYGNNKGKVKYSWSTGDTGKDITLKDLKHDTLVKVVLSDTVCSFTDSAFVKVIQNPEISLSAGPLACYADTIQLKPALLDTVPNNSSSPWYTLNADDSIANFEWFDAVNNILLSTADSIFITKDTAGNANQQVALKITDRYGCSGFDSLQLLDNSFFENAVPDKADVCEGASISFSAYPGFKYLWSTGSNSQSVNLGAISNDKTVTIKTYNDYCAYEDTVSIKVRKLPVIDLQEVACFNDSLRFSLTRYSMPQNTTIPYYVNYGDESLSKMEWFNLSNQKVGNGKEITSKAGGHFIFKLTDDQGCTSADTVMLANYDSIEAAIPDAMHLCNDTDVNLNAYPGFNYDWSTGAHTSSVKIPALQKDTVIHLHVYKNTCSFYDTIDMSIRQYPVVDLQNDTLICYKDPFIINPVKMSSPSSGISIPYYVNYGIDSLSTFDWFEATSNTYVKSGKAISVSKTGKYVLRVTDEVGCSASDTVGVATLQDIENFLPSDTSICDGDSLQLKALEGYIYEWNNDTSVNDEIIWVKGDSTYFLKLSYGSCNWSDSITIDVVQFPEVFTQDTISAQDSTILTAPAGYTYKWSTGSTDQSIKVNTSGDYWVELEMNGCIERDTVYVDVQKSIGIKEKSFSDQIKIYPNPANDHLTVELPQNSSPFNYEIFNIEGKIISTGVINKNTNSIDISQFNSGSFILKIFNNTLNSRVLFLKQ